MVEPTKKDPEIDRLIDDMAKTVNPESKGRVGSIKSGVCVLCNQPAIEFKDELSRKEYTISGMCQKCQDDVFGGDDEELDESLNPDKYPEDDWREDR